MNLIKVIHDHTFSNMNSPNNSSVATGLGDCPLGHSLCMIEFSISVTISIGNTTRTVDKIENLTTRTHAHDLQKKDYSSTNKGIIIDVRDDCPAGHSNCYGASTYPRTVLLITIGSLNNGTTTKLSPTNLIKKLSHTHSVSNSLLTETHQTGTLIGDICEAGHSDCLIVRGNWAISSVAYQSATTSSGVI